MSLLGVFHEVTCEYLGAAAYDSGDERTNGSTSSSAIDATYSKLGFNYDTGTSSAQAALFDQTVSYDSGTIWFHYLFDNLAFQDGLDMRIAADDASLIWRMTYNGSSSACTMTVYSYNDAASAASSTFAIGLNDRVAIDMAFNDGSVDVYKNGTLAGTITLDTRRRTAGTKLGYITLAAGSTGSNIIASEIMLADEPTVSWRLATLAPTGSGYVNDWTGDYTAVDEAQLNADEITIDAAGTYSMTYEDIPAGALTDMEILGVIVGSIGSADVSTTYPNLNNTYYNGSTEYDLETPVDFTSNAYKTPLASLHTTNPGTAAAWTESEVNNGEFGVKSS